MERDSRDPFNQTPLGPVLARIFGAVNRQPKLIASVGRGSSANAAKQDSTVSAVAFRSRCSAKIAQPV